jgi:hypothetical protein
VSRLRPSASARQGSEETGYRRQRTEDSREQAVRTKQEKRFRSRRAESLKTAFCPSLLRSRSNSPLNLGFNEDPRTPDLRQAGSPQRFDDRTRQDTKGYGVDEIRVCSCVYRMLQKRRLWYKFGCFFIRFLGFFPSIIKKIYKTRHQWHRYCFHSVVSHR